MSNGVVGNPQYMTKAQVARELGLRIVTIDKLIREGALVERRSYPGIYARFHADDVAALRARYERPASQTQTA